MTLLRYFADDPDFHGLLDHLFGWAVEEVCPPNLFLIRIDNWFDWKWLGFSGTGVFDGRRAFGPGAPSTFVRGVWTASARTQVPPFTPRRIVRQDHFLCGDGTLRRPSEPILVHPQERRRAQPHTDRLITDICDDGWFFWLSSDSASSGRGSLLSYWVGEGSVYRWYASFEHTRPGRWIVSRSKYVNRETLASFIDEYYGEGDAEP